jgi:hypothetical protein
MIRAFRYEMRHVTNEPWYADMISSLQLLPRFQSAWTAVDQEQPPASAARSLVPLCLIIPGAGPLRFHLSSEPFLRDARFRIISYFPADPATMRRCTAWAEQFGQLS